MSKIDDRDFTDRYKTCFVDFALKVGSGLLIGSMIGNFFMRCRRWPTLIGGGLGLGMAYANCEKNLNDYLESYGPKQCNLNPSLNLLNDNVCLYGQTVKTLFCAPLFRISGILPYAIWLFVSDRKEKSVIGTRLVLFPMLYLVVQNISYNLCCKAST